MNQSSVKNMFDRIAPKYDMLNSILSCRQHIRWKSSCLQDFRGKPTCLLDVATGTGDILFLATEKTYQV